ncbi:MAG: NAD(P)/FAD-dependent oxidoreductase, partial [Ornithinimicrobium sp.]
LRYLRESAREYGVIERIRYHHRVVQAQWSTAEARWTLDIEVTRVDGTEDTSTTSIQMTCAFLYSNTGYYRYDRGHSPDLAGVKNFAGTLIHPQHWPEGFDVTGKHVAIIGSGATTVTLVPELARHAASLTQVQRTPTYVAAPDSVDAHASWLKGRMPSHWIPRVMRTKYIAKAQFTAIASQFWPERLKRTLRLAAQDRLPPGYDVAASFQPPYNPWDQRLCVTPDGDLFKTISAGRARIVTSTIERVLPQGLQLSNGHIIEADVLITATGFDVLMLGGMTLRVDGRTIDPGEAIAFRGVMLSGVPNFAFTMGATATSWTLTSDLAAIYVCRVLAHLHRRGYRRVTPTLPAESAVWRTTPLFRYSSSYVRRSETLLPSQGDRRSWQMSEHYVAALLRMKYWPISHPDLTFD